MAGFTLNAFGALGDVGQSESRRATLTSRFEDLLGFDAGLERIAPKVSSKHALQARTPRR